MNDLSKCQICGNDAMTGHIICEGCDKRYEKTVNSIIAAWNRDAHPAIQFKALMALRPQMPIITFCPMIDRLNLHRDWLTYKFLSSNSDTVDHLMQKYGFPEFQYQPKQED